jgi:2-hydroxychromene-2-carboxylate isomerase
MLITVNRNGDHFSHAALPAFKIRQHCLLGGQRAECRDANGRGIMNRIDFWFSIGSTYSYLTVMRLDGVADREGVKFVWRPFNVREIMIEQNNIPFTNKPVKRNYMWRDIERRASMYDLPIAVPAPYPLKQLPFANQVAVLGMEEGWGPDYVKETYRLWFQKDLPAGEEPNISRSLETAGQDPVRVLSRARERDIEEALARETDAARQAGVFGSPSFVVAGELFWGDDRLDDAIAWAMRAK